MSEQPEQVWEVGQPVIIFSRYGSYGRNDHAVQVHKIESVAPKSFKVSHYRFRKDKLEVRTSGGFAGSTYEVCAMDDPRAEYLLAERFVQRQGSKVDKAERAWKENRTVENAADLQVELYAWVEAEQARAKAEAALRELQGRKPLLERVQ